MMQESTAESHAVIFLPYLRLRSAQAVSGIRFVPLLTSEDSPEESLSMGFHSIRTILSSYRDRAGHPLQNCTVVTVPGRGWDLTEADFSAAQSATSLLFLAAWAQNDYLPKFNGQYVNSSPFSLVGQRFSGSDPTFIGLKSRRRDGGKWDGGYRHGDALFAVPLQCSVSDVIAVDEAFLAGLDSADRVDSVDIKRLRSALSFVHLANTDDFMMRIGAEAILMASAFEQLMGSGQGARNLACLFGTLFHDCGSVPVSEARVARPGIRLDSRPDRLEAQLKWWVHKKWMEELHQLRSQAIHEGHVETDENWGWTAFEHLLMAAHVFPLVVKLLLQRAGHYTLSANDRARCKAVDRILAVTDWDQDEETGHGPRWYQIMHESIMTERFNFSGLLEPSHASVDAEAEDNGR